MDATFDFIIKNGGIGTKDYYPYKAVDGKCNINRKNVKVVSIDGFEDVPEYNYRRQLLTSQLALPLRLVAGSFAVTFIWLWSRLPPWRRRAGKAVASHLFWFWVALPATACRGTCWLLQAPVTWGRVGAAHGLT